MSKKKKVSYGIYEYKGFRIRKNVFSDYGYPKTAWVVNEPDGDEMGAIWTLKDALKWIDEWIRG
jgi:hypothetical protein